MVGCFAIADAEQTIRTDLDNELEGAFSSSLICSMDAEILNEGGFLWEFC